VASRRFGVLEQIQRVEDVVETTSAAATVSAAAPSRWITAMPSAAAFSIFPVIAAIPNGHHRFRPNG